MERAAVSSRGPGQMIYEAISLRCYEVGSFGVGAVNRIVGIVVNSESCVCWRNVANNRITRMLFSERECRSVVEAKRLGRGNVAAHAWLWRI